MKGRCAIVPAFFQILYYVVSLCYFSFNFVIFKNIVTSNLIILYDSYVDTHFPSSFKVEVNKVDSIAETEWYIQDLESDLDVAFSSVSYN